MLSFTRDIGQSLKTTGFRSVILDTSLRKDWSVIYRVTNIHTAYGLSATVNIVQLNAIFLHYGLLIIHAIWSLLIALLVTLLEIYSPHHIMLYNIHVVGNAQSIMPLQYIREVYSHKYYCSLH